MDVTSLGSEKAANDQLVVEAEEMPPCLLCIFLSVVRMCKQGRTVLQSPFGSLWESTLYVELT